MDPITQQTVIAAAGAGGGDPVYVDDVFSTYLYNGTGSNGLVINNGIDLAGEGGLVWIKSRPHGLNHSLHDTERGVNRKLVTHSTAGQTAYQANAGVNSFNSNGFTLGATSSGENAGLDGYASWTFRKAPGFFDVVTYSGDGTVRQIPHNLGSTPAVIIVKCTSHVNNWYVYTASTGATKSLFLDSTSAATTRPDWGNTAPTDSVFTVDGTTVTATNYIGRTYVAYLFAHDDASFGTDGDESIIKCGIYTGNGSATGPVINLGFEPQWIMAKSASGSGPWIIQDMMRSGDQNSSVDNSLNANTDGAESGFDPNLGVTATGFQPRSTSSYINTNGTTYIYMAIRRPHKPPEVATEVYQASAASSYAGTDDIPCNFAPDFFIATSRTLGGGFFTESRLTDKWLMTNATNAESSSNYYDWDGPGGVISLTGTAFSGDPIFWQFKRAPGFFDVVAYSGMNVPATSISHNLGVKPELVIFKKRDVASAWAVKYQGRDGLLGFTNGAANTSANYFDAEDTATVFYGRNGDNDTTYGPTNTFIAYLFATLPGISKVGSYSGSSSAVNVDCGFTNGARFVLIKRTNSSGGEWHLWDTTRGITNGNDPFLRLNTTGAQNTATDYIDPHPNLSGFSIPGSGTNDGSINAVGGTYIFLAIA